MVEECVISTSYREIVVKTNDRETSAVYIFIQVVEAYVNDTNDGDIYSNYTNFHAV